MFSKTRRSAERKLARGSYKSLSHHELSLAARGTQGEPDIRSKARIEYHGDDGKIVTHISPVRGNHARAKLIADAILHVGRPGIDPTDIIKIVVTTEGHKSATHVCLERTENFGGFAMATGTLAQLAAVNEIKRARPL